MANERIARCIKGCQTVKTDKTSTVSAIERYKTSFAEIGTDAMREYIERTNDNFNAGTKGLRKSKYNRHF